MAVTHCCPSDVSVDRIDPCSHEEADTRMFLHVAHAVQEGHRKIMIRTVDTDVVVLAISCCQRLAQLEELWVAFGTGRNLRYLASHELSKALGQDRSLALPFFHAFSGCDTVSSFVGHGKKSAWNTWSSFPDVTKAFLELSSQPDPAQVTQCLPLLERFVVLLYDRTSNMTAVNAARKQLFSKKGRPMESLPPTQGALIQHTNRAVFQSGYVWFRSLQAKQDLPFPCDWGWIKDDEGGVLRPLWSSLPDIAKCCPELLHCSCKKGCSKRCTCVKAVLPCTALCYCDGDCTRDHDQ